MNSDATSRPDFHRLKAAQIMRRSVTTFPADTPLDELERALHEEDFSGTPITDHAGRITGILSLRDIIAHHAETSDSDGSPTAATETAADIMSANIHSVAADTPLPGVAKAMVDHEIHRVLVHTDEGFVGMVTATDILRAIAQQHERK